MSSFHYQELCGTFRLLHEIVATDVKLSKKNNESKTSAYFYKDIFSVLFLPPSKGDLFHSSLFLCA